MSASRYLPYGEIRWGGTGPTDFGFTGQRAEAGFGLMDYGARYYSPYLNRFVSPDTIIPNPTNPQSLNRYAYAYNNSVKYRDPSGHIVETIWDVANIVIGVGSLGYNLYEGNYADAAIDAGGLVIDVAAAAIPVVPGGAGAAIKAARLANTVDNVVDTVNTVDNVVDAVNQIDNAVDVANQADNLVDAANYLTDAGKKGPYRGGRYGDLPGERGIEKHHMPAKSVSPLSVDDGPAIQMDRLDHYDTASWGRGGDAYRAEQKKLIDQGQFDDAIQMDIDDIQSKFGDKYDEAILEMIDKLP